MTTYICAVKVEFDAIRLAHETGSLAAPVAESQQLLTLSATRGADMRIARASSSSASERWSLGNSSNAERIVPEDLRIPEYAQHRLSVGPVVGGNPAADVIRIPGDEPGST